MLCALLRVFLAIILLAANAAAQNPVKLDRQTSRTLDQQLGDVNQLLEAGRTGHPRNSVQEMITRRFLHPDFWARNTGIGPFSEWRVIRPEPRCEHLTDSEIS